MCVLSLGMSDRGILEVQVVTMGQSWGQVRTQNRNQAQEMTKLTKLEQGTRQKLRSMQEKVGSGDWWGERGGRVGAGRPHRYIKGWAGSRVGWYCSTASKFQASDSLLWEQTATNWMSLAYLFEVLPLFCRMQGLKDHSLTNNLVLHWRSVTFPVQSAAFYS